MIHVRRLAVILWIIAIAGVSIRVMVTRPTSQSVVPIFRAAGERWLASESLYAPAPPHDTFRYPPIFAIIFAGESYLPETLGALIWRWIGIASLLGGGWLFSKRFAPGSFAVISLLTMPMIFGSFNNGQANVLVTGLMLTGVAIAGPRWMWAAALLAMATAIKVYPIAAGLLMGLLERAKFTAAFLIFTALLCALPFVCQSPSYVRQQHLELAEWLDRDDRLHSDHPTRLPRDWTCLTRQFGFLPESSTVRIVSVVSGLVLAIGLLVLRRTLGVEPSMPYVILFAGIWMTLFGPATEPVTYCFLAPGIAWFIATQRGVCQWLAIAGYALIVSPVVREFFPGGSSYSAMGPQPAGTVLVLIATVVTIVKSVRLGKP